MKVKIAAFSAWARPEPHLSQQTAHGAAVTICGALLALILFIHETSHFWGLHTAVQMAVDLERRHDLPINLDMTLPAMPCAMVSLDALDISGTTESDNSASSAKDMTVHKIRLTRDGRRIGRRDYLTPQSQEVVSDGVGGSMVNVNVQLALKHLTDMEEEAAAQEGCHLRATLLVKRVAGRVHISVHQQMLFRMLPQLMAGHRMPVLRNLSHVIHSLSFGPHYPGRVNPLDGTTRILDTGFASFKYWLKVVPTEVYGRLGGVTETHQYSVAEYVQPLADDAGAGRPPGIDLLYDLSPIVVTLNMRPPSILHYVVRISAVVGGVFAITRMVDRQVHWLVSLRSR